VHGIREKGRITRTRASMRLTTTELRITIEMTRVSRKKEITDTEYWGQIGVNTKKDCAGA
jgi:hypothetical protein